MPKTCQIYAKDIPNICHRYTKDMPKIFQRYAKDIPKICQRYVRGNSRINEGERGNNDEEEVGGEFFYLYTYKHGT